MHQEIGTQQAAKKFNVHQEIEVGRLLIRTLHDPNSVQQHIAE